MTGADLKKWIEDNHAEDLEIAYTDNLGNDTIIDKAEITRIPILHNGRTWEWDKTVIYLS